MFKQPAADAQDGSVAEVVNVINLLPNSFDFTG